MASVIHPEQVRALTNWTFVIKTNVYMKVTIYYQLINIITVILHSLNSSLLFHYNFYVFIQDNRKLPNFLKVRQKHSCCLSNLAEKLITYQDARRY